VTSWGANRLDIFVRSENDTLYHKYWTGGVSWSGFADRGAYP